MAGSAAVRRRLARAKKREQKGGGAEESESIVIRSDVRAEEEEEAGETTDLDPEGERKRRRLEALREEKKKESNRRMALAFLSEKSSRNAERERSPSPSPPRVSFPPVGEEVVPSQVDIPTKGPSHAEFSGRGNKTSATLKPSGELKGAGCLFLADDSEESEGSVAGRKRPRSPPFVADSLPPRPSVSPVSEAHKGMELSQTSSLSGQSLRQLTPLDDATDEDDIVSIARLSQQRRRAEKPKLKSAGNSCESDMECDTGYEKKRMVSRAASPERNMPDSDGEGEVAAAKGDDDDDDGYDLMSMLRRSDQIKAERNQTRTERETSQKVNAAPKKAGQRRNPLAAERRQEEEFLELERKMLSQRRSRAEDDPEPPTSRPKQRSRTNSPRESPTFPKLARNLERKARLSPLRPSFDDDELFGDPSADEASCTKGESSTQRRRKVRERSPGRDADTERPSRAKRQHLSPLSPESDGESYSRRREFSPRYSPVRGFTDENELKPDFANPKLGPPSDFVPLKLEPGEGAVIPFGHEVPASMTRYLPEYQREGIRFLYGALAGGKGAILGDDMGLGKTVQLVSLLAALLEKTGTGKDLNEITRRQRLISSAVREREREAKRALMDGVLLKARADHGLAIEGVTRRPWSPVLVVVPASVTENWSNEFGVWGHFAVAEYNDPAGRLEAIKSVRNGANEVMITTRSLLQRDETFEPLSLVQWRLIVVDEFHEYKNQKSQCYKNLEEIKRKSKCPVIGMTGTPMQNDHKELWSLVNLVQPGLLGDWKTFQNDVVRPLRLARQKTARFDLLAGEKKIQEQLNILLRRVYISRKKDDVLKESLTTKNEHVIFCELSPVQKLLYQRILSLPDYQLLLRSSVPCDCGVNQKFFAEYKQLRNRAEQRNYYRRNKKSLIPRKACCYKMPKNPKWNEPDEPLIHPEAVLWKSQHADGCACKKCPGCISLPALAKLYKVCSHPCLLQLEHRPDHFDVGSKQRQKASHMLEFAKVAMTPEILNQMPGTSYFRENHGIMDDHAALSGKMESLRYLLRKYESHQDKVLLFSHSTATLDMIQKFVQAKGYSHLRLDGTVNTGKRQALVDEFQNNENKFIFLISTRAGGLGLNLTAANKVIVFDVDWNPSYDEQAQDRAFRIGQNRDVEVTRLVARGTVEELIYARQVYKVHLKQQVLQSGGRNNEGSGIGPARIFRGVVGDKDRKGELFGLENLLRFKDGSFMDEMWRSADNGRQRKHQVRAMSDVQTMLTNMEEEDRDDVLGGEEPAKRMVDWISAVVRDPVDGGAASKAGNDDNDDDDDGKDDLGPNLFGINHADLMRADRGGAALQLGDDGYEDEMGGESQIAHVALCEETDRLSRDASEAPAGGAATTTTTKKAAKTKQQQLGFLSPVREAAELDDDPLEDPEGNETKASSRVKIEVDQVVSGGTSTGGPSCSSVTILGVKPNRFHLDSNGKMVVSGPLASIASLVYVPSYLQ